ncbi:crotonobetainyl-CoA:carnitine CoA-transferase CaiB-like acyl-CoA transferase [Rhizobium aquaticum]|uniref:Crotonobetainyl-CoA:carnitine CoA-transferase CaiB-like acyl-CoA transferase n=1 Tax=Rhizobium aquaticum TaxID=1549636 RepID=A0ABV2J6L5_9HYPH
MRHALGGVRVVDFTQIAAGPTCTMLLADLGAQVIKVEAPEGDLGRKLGPGWIGDDASLFHAVNRNKQGIALDLKSPGGVDVARRLAASADVMVESMRPGVMTRLGLGYARVAEDNPRLIYCAISAYGQSGPYAGKAGVDGILQADSGLMSIIGSAGGDPVKVQAPAVDVFSGNVAAMAILAKLHQRNRDGQGGFLDVNLLNAALALQHSSIANYLADCVLPERIGSAAPYSAPNEAFETSDGWIMVAAYNGGRWERLCVQLGCPEIQDDPRFRTSSDRVANRTDMRNILAPCFRSQSTSHWLKKLTEADILCAPVATYANLLEHPQVEANGMITQVSHPRFGMISAPGRWCVDH